MTNQLQNAIDQLETAYNGSRIKTSLQAFITALYTAAANTDGKGFKAKYLGGIYVGDFVTKQELNDYFTSGTYFEHKFTAQNKTSTKAISTGLFEDYFGNASELAMNYYTIFDLPAKKGK